VVPADIFLHFTRCLMAYGIVDITLGGGRMYVSLLRVSERECDWVE